MEDSNFSLLIVLEGIQKLRNAFKGGASVTVLFYLHYKELSKTQLFFWLLFPCTTQCLYNSSNLICQKIKEFQNPTIMCYDVPIGVARSSADPTMDGPRFSWLYTDLWSSTVWPDNFSDRYDALSHTSMMGYTLPFSC